jgi:hypothetical protein
VKNARKKVDHLEYHHAPAACLIFLGCIFGSKLPIDFNEFRHFSRWTDVDFIPIMNMYSKSTVIKM